MRNDWWAHQSGSWGPWAAFGLGPKARFFEFGEVRLAILSLLAEGPKHGYQIMKEMQERSGGMYRASAGSIYPTLQQLEDEGLVEAERQDGRRVYRITAAGRAELESDPEAVRRIWERAGNWEGWGQFMGPQVLAFAGPMATLMKATLRASAWSGGQPERDKLIRGILERACSELEKLTEGRS